MSDVSLNIESFDVSSRARAPWRAPRGARIVYWLSTFRLTWCTVAFTDFASRSLLAKVHPEKPRNQKTLDGNL